MSQVFYEELEKRAYVYLGGGGVQLGHEKLPVSARLGYSNLLGLVPVPSATLRVGTRDAGVSVGGGLLGPTLGIDTGAEPGTRIYRGSVLSGKTRSKKIDKRDLRNMAIGSAVGLPVGYGVDKLTAKPGEIRAVPAEVAHAGAAIYGGALGGTLGARFDEDKEGNRLGTEKRASLQDLYQANPNTVHGAVGGAVTGGVLGGALGKKGKRGRAAAKGALVGTVLGGGGGHIKDLYNRNDVLSLRSQKNRDLLRKSRQKVRDVQSALEEAKKEHALAARDKYSEGYRKAMGDATPEYNRVEAQLEYYQNKYGPVQYH